jgi:acyl-coenzyme A synthetase/AMP-(fatty) acid ligase
MDRSEQTSLWTHLRRRDLRGQFLNGATAHVMLSELESGSAIRTGLAGLKGRSVMIAAEDQLASALALIELDGVARRIVLCPPGVAGDSIPGIVKDASVDAIVSDLEPASFANIPSVMHVTCSASIEGACADRIPAHETEWVLFTSGTTGRPKMAVHRLPGLTGAINPNGSSSSGIIWGTFYDMRRYGGLQIFLRAILGNCSFVLSGEKEHLNEHLERLAKHGVTHLTGTPSHWRRVLMSASAQKIAPSYVRLSGEIADQGALDGLRALFPKAPIVHAYASTEAGVGFEVDDEKAGFPASYIGRRGEVEMKVEDGSLHIRSGRAALRYLTEGSPKIAQDDGFVDTGDLVELRNARYYFVGRKDGVINVGGQKVHPEEVEAVINRHPRVRMSLVRARKNAIIGSLVIAEIVPDSGQAGEDEDLSNEELENEIRVLCAGELARHKVPALIRFVPALNMTAGGKLARNNA